VNSDIREMKNFFRCNYDIPESHITTLKDKKADKKHILSAIRKISEKTPDDKKIIIYYT
jgi:hypothetical protein